MRIHRATATGFGIGAALFLLHTAAPHAEPLTAYYAADLGRVAGRTHQFSFDESDGGYRSEIGIQTEGLPRWFTHFKATAESQGRLADDGAAHPERYAAHFDLRKSHDRLISFRYVERDGAVVADRAPEDTTTKPPLAENFRSDVLDPVAALVAIRARLLRQPPVVGQNFTVPVYDGARRFDVLASVASVGGPEQLIRLQLTLRPIAGFKGESSDQGDPDSAPRPVDVAFTDDARVLPVSLRVRVAFLPLHVDFGHLCASFDACDAEEPGH